MRRIIPLAIAFTTALALLGYGGARADTREVLRIFNATEYVDRTTIADFEKEFNIQVIYDEFESNEEMYDIISRDPKAYDVLVPSDYTIEDAATRISNNVYVQYVFSSFNFICKYLIAARIENGYKLPDNHKIEDLRYFTEI